VTVRLNDYEYGKPYELKVTGGSAEVGNFMALDFGTLRHTPYWTQQDPANTRTCRPQRTPTTTPTSPVRRRTTSSCISGMPSGLRPVTFPALPPAMRCTSGSDRSSGLHRLGRSRPASVEPAGPRSGRREDPAHYGQTPLRVINFATFYVEAINERGGDVSVTGRFVEYTAPSVEVSDEDPNSPFAVQAVHLTSEGLDF